MQNEGKKQEKQMSEFLQVAVDNAIERIQRHYEETEGKIYLGFSGGKDSTVLAHLIMMANLPTKIPFVFANTGIELTATLEFVKQFDYENIVVVKPRKPYGQVIREYGKPAISKLKSECLKTYQGHIDEPYKTARARQMITGDREKNGVIIGGKNSVNLANTHMHFLHPDTEFKIANKCCLYMKKYPFKDFAKENDMNGAYSGVRTAEGGARALKYKTCTVVKMENNKKYITSLPIYDWSDEIVEEFIEYFNIKLSDAYEVYGCKRTGCIGCAYSQDLKKELKMLYDYEPLKYKAVMKWNKDVYMYQLVECEWDEEYMKEFNEKKPIIEQRRREMMDKFRSENMNKQ